VRTKLNCQRVLLLPQVALRRVLQTIDAGMPDAEASRYIICSQSEQDTDWCVTQDTGLEGNLKQI
jgi:hypothetical protein